MPDSPASTPTDDERLEARLDEIAREGPRGAFAVAGVATAIVVAIVVVFYFAVYLPRGVVQ